MNARLAVAFLAVVTSTGCLVVGTGKGGGAGGGGGGGSGGGAGRSGDVTISWTFGGKTCADYPQVQSLAITIPGETLNNGGIYPCLDSTSYPGISLKNFLPGGYTFTIDALDSGNRTLFSGAGSFNINGDTRVDVDLTPAGGPNSFAYLTWTFPPMTGAPNPTCTEAGVANVLVSIDGVAADTYDCTLGRANPGVQTPYLSAGSHSIQLSGADAGGYVYFRYTGTLTTFAGNPVGAAFQLPWAVGGVAVKWNLNDSVGPLSCAMAGVTDVYVNFQDAQGALVYPSTTAAPGDKKSCTAVGVEYPFLKPGTYIVQLTAFGTGGKVFQEDTSPPGAITVTAVAGQFVDPLTNATPVKMVRIQ